MIPEKIDPIAMIHDLNGWGMKDSKIEFACGFSVGYVSQIKCGNLKRMSYPKGAALFNLHEERMLKSLAHSNSSAGTIPQTTV